MRAFRLWAFMALTWLFVDWIIAGDLILKWAGAHLEPGVAFASMCSPAMTYWFFHQRPNAWGKISTYKGFLVCGIAAVPAIPVVRVIHMIASNPQIVGNVPWFAAVLFITGIMIVLAAKIAVCVHWWKKLVQGLAALDKVDG
jgi:hypothetical protein